MRTGQPIIGRPAWYDRNPVTTFKSYYEGNVAPHGLTERWTYTVPSGKKALVELIAIWMNRTAAPTTLGRAEARLLFFPSGGSETPLVYSVLYDSNVGAEKNVNIGQSSIMLQGDKIRATTYDGSIGGNVSYLVLAKITEFDA
jgi:hypothetical protein